MNTTALSLGLNTGPIEFGSNTGRVKGLQAPDGSRRKTVSTLQDKRHAQSREQERGRGNYSIQGGERSEDEAAECGFASEETGGQPRETDLSIRKLRGCRVKAGRDDEGPQSSQDAIEQPGQSVALEHERSRDVDDTQDSRISAHSRNTPGQSPKLPNSLTFGGIPQNGRAKTSP